MNRTPTPAPASPDPSDRAGASQPIRHGRPRVQTVKPPIVPSPAGPAKEDEAADPVGDGYSDAELAERLSGQNPRNAGQNRQQD